jgi:hypothetical protein
MGGGDARTPKRNHVNLSAPSSPSDGESAREALGSSRHTRSRGILRDCISASTPCSWHSTSICAGEAAESEVVVKAAEREALVALERFVKAMDASGPASVRMCYDCDEGLVAFATCGSPCTRVRPNGEGRAVSGHPLPYVLQKKGSIYIFRCSLTSFFSPITYVNTILNVQRLKYKSGSKVRSHFQSRFLPDSFLDSTRRGADPPS